MWLGVLRELTSATRDEGRRLVTCDVFDTALLRKVVDPSSVFLLLGGQLRAAGAWTGSAEAFRAARIHAERAARSRSPGQETTLVEIYEVLGRSGQLPPDPEAFSATEEALEEQLLVANTHCRSLLDAVRPFATVAFVSDTYFPSSFVARQLAAHGLAQPGEQVHVSCEEATSKRLGDLFHRVAEHHGVPLSAMAHIGDNHVADVEVPRRLGIWSRQVATPSSRYETILERYAAATGGVSALAAGCSRIQRNESAGRHAPAFVEVVAGLMAPTLMAFVDWALIEAQRLGAADVAFVSRDGETLVQVADRLLAPPTGADAPRLVYLHGGRRAWHLAGLDPMPATPPEWFLEESQRHRADTALAAISLSPDEVPITWTRAARSWPRMSILERSALLSALWTEPTVRAVVEPRARAQRELLHRYLVERGLGTRPWAVVDLGWRARSGLSLATAIGSTGLVAPSHLYFGLRDLPPEFVDTRVWRTYFFCTPEPAPRNEGLVSMFQLLEMACTASHGPVIGYEERDGAVEPRLLTDDNPEADAWGAPDLQRLVLDTVSRVPPALARAEPVDLRPAIGELLAEFLVRPTASEIEYWRDFPYAHDSLGREIEPLAAKWRRTDVLKYLRWNLDPPSNWVAASRRGAPWWRRPAFAARRIAGRWLRPLRDSLGRHRGRRP